MAINNTDHSLVAVLSLPVTCTVMITDDGYWRVSTGCTCPSLSPIVYVDFSKLTIATIIR